MTEAQYAMTPSTCPADLVIESNHRITNNLALLTAIVSRQAALIRNGPTLVPSEELVQVLVDLESKMLSVARLHRTITKQPTQADVDLNEALTDVLQEYSTAGLYGDRLRVRSTLPVRHIVSASHACMLTLALSEIVTNAMKYAHPTGLPVELSIASASAFDGGLVLQIDDDGVGFPEGFVEPRDAGIGLKLVRSLVENAGGNLQIESDPLGLRFTIRLPPQKKSPM